MTLVGLMGPSPARFVQCPGVHCVSCAYIALLAPAFVGPQVIGDWLTEG